MRKRARNSGAARPPQPPSSRGQGPEGVGEGSPARDRPSPPQKFRLSGRAGPGVDLSWREIPGCLHQHGLEGVCSEWAKARARVRVLRSGLPGPDQPGPDKADEGPFPLRSGQGPELSMNTSTFAAAGPTARRIPGHCPGRAGRTGFPLRSGPGPELSSDAHLHLRPAARLKECWVQGGWRPPRAEGRSRGALA